MHNAKAQDSEVQTGCSGKRITASCRKITYLSVIRISKIHLSGEVAYVCTPLEVLVHWSGQTNTISEKNYAPKKLTF